MILARHLMALIAFICAAIESGAAQARCDDMLTLAFIYSNYMIILTEEGDAQNRAAARLYPTLANMKPQDFAQKLEIDETRWRSLHDEASRLSQGLITGLSYSKQSVTSHTNNVGWIFQHLKASGCDFLKDLGDGSGTGSRVHSHTYSDKSSERSNASITKRTLFNWATLIAVIGGLIGALVGALVIIKGRQFRIQRMQRLPRRLVHIEFDIEYPDPAATNLVQHVKALDISLGGMKIRVEDTLIDGVDLILKLAIGDRAASVVWSNTFYAGIMFSEQLSQTELDALLKTIENSL